MMGEMKNQLWILTVMKLMVMKISVDYHSVRECMATHSNKRIWLKVYECTWIHLKSNVEVIGNIFGAELAFCGDVNIQLAVNWCWMSHASTQQP